MTCPVAGQAARVANSATQLTAHIRLLHTKSRACEHCRTGPQACEEFQYWNQHINAALAEVMELWTNPPPIQ